MSLSSNNANTLCCEFSLQEGEQLFGTAPRVDVWFLLEHRSAWGRDAFAESDLPQAVKTRLNALLEATPRSRLQLIKQPGRMSDEIMFYIALSSESDPRLYQLSLSAYDDLLELDIPAIVARNAQHDGALTPQPLYLVCTNGRRDVCCARFGLPLYNALTATEPLASWQTNHVGGHRFAAMLLCLPHGIYYGRVTPDDVTPIANAYRDGHIVPEFLRGRCCYDKIVQAADYYLRRQSDVTTLAHFRLLDLQNEADDVQLVRFESQADGQAHEIRLAAGTPVEILKSSGDTQTAPIPQWRLLGNRGA